MRPADPAWLILLVLLPLLATAAVLAARTRAKQWSAFVAERLRPRLLRRSSPLPRWIAFGCLLLACALLIIALSRPQSESGRTTEKILGRNLIFMLDLSRSMNVRDVQPDRLTQAKATAYELLEALPNDRIGVIGFTSSPYLFAPLTVDHRAVRETITELDTDWLPTGASNIAAGLELGIETLKATGVRQNAIILLTDGEETSGSLVSAAEKAEAAGIEVITIGFGTAEGEFVPDDSLADGRFRDRRGREVISRLETDNLREISRVTGGRFAIASSGADIPAMVEAAIADLDRVELEGRETTIVTEYYQWFLLPGILLLVGSIVAATRWRGLHASTQAARTAALAVFVSLAFAAPQVQAARYDEALGALADERYGDAVSIFGELAEKHAGSEKGFRYQLARATAAYHAGDWPTARRGFSEALRAEHSQVRAAAHHGLGNTLFEIGWARLSEGARYPEVPGESGAGGPDGPPDTFEQLSDALLDMPERESPQEAENLDAFEFMAKQHLAEWLAEEPDESGRSEGRERFERLVTDWIDAVDHFDDAGPLEAAGHNRQVAYRHLEKLREILRELEQNAQQIQALPDPQPLPEDAGPSDPGDAPEPSDPGEEPGEEGPGEEEQGEGEPEDEREGEGSEGGDDPEDSGQSSDEPGEEREGESGETSQAPPEPEEPESPQPRPDETPEEAARRILEENADLQHGTLSPGRQRFERPEKDW